MTRKSIFRIKNAMLFANLISNMIGVAVVLFLTRGSGAPQFPEIIEMANKISAYFVPCAFLVPTFLTVFYELPIRKYLNGMANRDEEQKEVPMVVRQRLLNEPFFLIAMDMGIWLISAFIYAVAFWSIGASKTAIQIN
ncbi:hypothetical protein ACFL4N_09265, partial [Thermodesulfobacteriota bacterium]